MAIKFANNVTTYLSTGITNTQTSFDVVSTTGFPTLVSGDYFYATIYSYTGPIEIIKVTGVSGGTITCVRGQDNTAAQSWVNGSPVDIRLTAAGLYESGVASNGMFQNASVITANETVASGYNAISGGPITIASGVTVTVSTGSNWSIV
jgi:hypothetical protein